MRCFTFPGMTKALCLVAGAVLFFGGGTVHGEVVPGEDFNANLNTSAATLQGWYNHRGLWHTTDWWNAANCVEALEDVIVANNGGDYTGVLARTFQLNSRTNFLNEYYDDEGWWALAWIRAYDVTGQAHFLKMSKTIFADMAASWDDHCDGGIWWRKDRRYKNAIANELFMLVAVRLHQRTPSDAGTNSYLAWAVREWKWFNHSGMINTDNLINDGLDRWCENNGHTVWTYNQGVILGGLTDLYKATGDTYYLRQAVAIADAAIATLVNTNGVLQEPCEKIDDCHGGDSPQFKGIFIRYLAYLYDVTRKPEYGEFLDHNAHAVWFNDRNESNQLGLRWTGPFDLADAARHSSAMFAISAVASPSTKLLPFARGAAEPTFNHSIGRASGTLGWRCDPVSHPGFILSGPYLESLSEGIHVVHFRLAVDRIGAATNALVRLDIKDGTGVLTSKDIAWNSFARESESQDFQLVFTNSAKTDPLAFRVYWNGVSDTPALTLTDVTVDGTLNWTAANLSHEIGRLDGRNTWEADPVRDHASGLLVTGPGTSGLPAGKCSATFELKVDNFNWDKSIVATISVVDADSGKIIVTRDLKRNEFPNTLYQTFTLNFTADTGKRYDFRTFWHFAPDAPRLTQRSVVVNPKKLSAVKAP